MLILKLIDNLIKAHLSLATPLMDKRLKAPTLKRTLRENVRQMLVKATDLSNEYQAEQQLRITPTKKSKYPN